MVCTSHLLLANEDVNLYAGRSKCFVLNPQCNHLSATHMLSGNYANYSVAYHKPIIQFYYQISVICSNKEAIIGRLKKSAVGQPDLLTIVDDGLL